MVKPTSPDGHSESANADATGRSTALDRWHRENDDVFRRMLISIALPSTAEPLNATHRTRVTRWFGTFERCLPLITAQDVMGLIVTRLTQEFLPAGTLNGWNIALANYKGLSLAIQAEPQRMQLAGFAVPLLVPSSVPERAMWEAALRVRRRWLDWYGAVLDPYRDARSKREEVVRGLARMYCFREMASERAAAREACVLLAADSRRRGRGQPILEPDDILGEVYTLEPGKSGAAKLLRLRKDGHFTYRPRALRNIVRKARHGASVRPDAVSAVARRPRCDDPCGHLDAADLHARLLDECDAIDALIVRGWRDTNAELGRRFGMSGQAIGKRRSRIVAAAARLGVDLPA